tara:strand:+ start:247 stop:696 length:450 start_codon:yes stop_codon:yes gene_type:complete
MATKRFMPKTRVRRAPWTIEHVTYLINNMHLSNEELSDVLDRTVHAIENKLSKLRKTHNIGSRTQAINNAAVTMHNSNKTDEGFYFEEPSVKKPNEQLSMLQTEENVFEETFKPKQVEYTLTWEGAVITFKAAGMYIGTNGLPKFVLEE